MYQLQKYGKEYDFRWLEERLNALGFRLVFCTRTPQSFEAARTERLKVSGNPKQYDDLSLFFKEQELLRSLVAQSILPKFELDISDDNIPHSVNAIADWIASTGGLWAK